MIKIIHGSDSIASRNYLNTFLEEGRKANKTVISYLGADVTADKLVLDLEPQSLFGDEKLVVIENIFSRRESQEKKVVLSILQSGSGDIVLWESKAIKKADQSVFPKAQIIQLDLKPTIFNFLDSVGKPLSILMPAFHTALAQDPSERLIISLAGRLKLLLIAREDPDNLPADGFYKTKLLSQSKLITPQKLAWAIRALHQIDLDQKTGNSTATLETSLDLFLAQL
jgi:hypothetical protein